MNVDLDYKKALDELIVDVLRSEKILESEQKAFLQKAGGIIRKNIKQIIPKTNKDHEHIREDIKVKVSGKKTGVTSVTVFGGAQTGYKWHMLDDGTRKADGSVKNKPMHFTQKAMEKATPEIERLLNDLERSIVND